MWIVRLALRRPYTFIVLALLIVLLGVFSILRTPTDIFPNINIPVISANLVLYRTAARGHGQSHRRQCRALCPDHGERCGALRIAVAVRHLGGQILLPAQRQRRTGVRADHRRLADAVAAGASGYDAALHTGVQRIDGADPAARAVEPDAVGGAAVRRRQQHRAPGPGYGGRRVRCRIPTAASSARLQVDLDPEALRAKGLRRRRRQQCHRRAEPDHSGRHRKNRRYRIQRQAQFRAR